MGNRTSVKPTAELDERKCDDITKKTGLTRDEIVQMHAEFLRDCPNGKLDKKLFTKIYKQLYPGGNATKFCNICFSCYDKDKSGFIDFYEFANAMGILLKGKVEDKLKLAFDIYDYNDDGFIEKKEAETIVNSLFQMYGEDMSQNVVKTYVDKLMSKFDKDHNGLLSEKEFVEGCMNDQEMRQFFSPYCK